MHNYLASNTLNAVSYDIRGPLLREAERLENEGRSVIRLNIGNPAPYQLNTPPALLDAIRAHLDEAQGYSDSKGLLSAREAILAYSEAIGHAKMSIDNIFLGNGVSELIQLSMQALINVGDEVLIPAPDYPLWSAVVVLCGGRPIYYRCDETKGWLPDIDDIRAKTTPKTRALLIINPNNPTGAVYPKEVLQAIAMHCESHRLIALSDEIYDQLLFDGHRHIPLSRYINHGLCFTYGGLSKNYRAAGLRSGWLCVSGTTQYAEELLKGLELLSSMRLCANVTAQLAIQVALSDLENAQNLVQDGGRLHMQRGVVLDRLSAISGVECMPPQGALYAFPRLDQARYKGITDHQFALALLRNEGVLIVPGSSFQLSTHHHFRITLLPDTQVLHQAFDGIERELARMGGESRVSSQS